MASFKRYKASFQLGHADEKLFQRVCDLKQIGQTNKKEPLVKRVQIKDKENGKAKPFDKNNPISYQFQLEPCGKSALKNNVFHIFVQIVT